MCENDLLQLCAVAVHTISDSRAFRKLTCIVWSYPNFLIGNIYNVFYILTKKMKWLVKSGKVMVGTKISIKPWFFICICFRWALSYFGLTLYSGTPPYDHPVFKTTSLLRPYSSKPNVKNIDSFYYFEDPVNATTSLLRPGFYGPTVVVLTGFHGMWRLRGSEAFKVWWVLPYFLS